MAHERARAQEHGDRPVPKALSIGICAILLVHSSAIAQDRSGAVRTQIKLLGSTDPATVKRAAEQLVAFGGPAAPALVDALGEGSEVQRQLSGGVLIRIGDPAIPALIERGLSSDNNDRRQLAMACLIKIGPSAAPALKKAAESSDERSASAARLVLSKLPKTESPTPTPGATPGASPGSDAPAEADPKQIKKLIDELADEDPKNRLNAAVQLARIGRPAVAPLREALDHDSANVRENAALALGQMREAAIGALDRLIAHFSDRVPIVRRRCAEACALIGEGAMTPVGEALEGIAPETRVEALFSLGMIGAKARVVGITRIARMLNDENKLVRHEAALSLCKIGFAEDLKATDFLGALETIPDFAEALDDRNATIRANAALALKFFGNNASKAIPRLVAHLGDLSSIVQGHCIDALETHAEAAVGPTRAALKSPNPLARKNAALTLGRLAAHAQSAVPDLQAMSSDKNDDARRAAQIALLKIKRASSGS